MITRKLTLAAIPAALAIAFGAYAQTGVISPNASNTTTAQSSTSAPGPTTATTPHTATGASEPRTISPHRNTTGSSPHASGASLAKSDLKFVEKTAADGLAEVELGKLAQQKAQNDEVKKFADRMVTDHAKANDQLKPIADAKNVALPNGLDKKHQKDFDRLAKLDGDKFDREYMKHMVSDHKKDVKEFEKEAKKGKDDDVKNFASSALPTLEEHLRLAEATNDTVKGKKR